MSIDYTKSDMIAFLERKGYELKYQHSFKTIYIVNGHSIEQNVELDLALKPNQKIPKDFELARQLEISIVFRTVLKDLILSL